MPLGKAQIYLFSPQQWINSRVRLDSSALVKQPVLEKENSEFKKAVLYLKIDLLLHPTHGGGDA